MTPVCIELFAGLHGWGEGFVAEGFRVVGFDIVDMCATLGVPRPAGCELVLQDALTLHGSQFRDAACIVASPPCQAYSYRAMPWKRAKALPPPDNSLFEACFRIQREACKAKNCRVGRGRCNAWATCLRPAECIGHFGKLVCSECFDWGWERFGPVEPTGDAMARRAGYQHIPLIVENVRGAQRWVGKARWRFGSYYLWGDVPALMPHGFASKGFARRFEDTDFAWFSSKSPARKAASAMIAKIPFPLANHIARCFLPQPMEATA